MPCPNCRAGVGRLGFIVTNEWMKAGYGEPLRRQFGDAAWVESVIDLGHTKEVFPEADVFPCILIVRKPTTADSASDQSRGCVQPLQANARETLGLERRVSDLVNAAYGLTPDNVALEWRTAPPRMPIPVPEEKQSSWARSGESGKPSTPIDSGKSTEGQGPAWAGRVAATGDLAGR